VLFSPAFLDLLGNLKLSGEGSKASDADKKSQTNKAPKVKEAPIKNSDRATKDTGA